MLGGDSLYELRTSLQLAELDRRGGISTRNVAAGGRARRVGGLLQQAGFKLLTVDIDDIIVDYPHSFALMQDLQAMGESNAVLGRETCGIRRDVPRRRRCYLPGATRERRRQRSGYIPADIYDWVEGREKASNSLCLAAVAWSASRTFSKEESKSQTELMNHRICSSRYNAMKISCLSSSG